MATIADALATAPFWVWAYILQLLLIHIYDTDAMKSFAKDHVCKDAPTHDESGRHHTHSIG